MRKYTSPRTVVVTVQQATSLLTTSGNIMHIDTSGAQQIESW